MWTIITFFNLQINWWMAQILINSCCQIWPLSWLKLSEKPRQICRLWGNHIFEIESLKTIMDICARSTYFNLKNFLITCCNSNTTFQPYSSKTKGNPADLLWLKRVSYGYITRNLKIHFRGTFKSILNSDSHILVVFISLNLVKHIRNLTGREAFMELYSLISWWIWMFISSSLERNPLREKVRTVFYGNVSCCKSCYRIVISAIIFIRKMGLIYHRQPHNSRRPSSICGQFFSLT